MSDMGAPDQDAPVAEKIAYSIKETVWYGPVLIYTAVMVTISVALMITGVTI